jgi:hypothetical protein
MAKLKYHNGQEWEQLAPNMEEYNTTKGMIGTLANLLTTAKNNLVVAINEIFGWVEDVETDLDTHKAERATETELGHVKAKTKEDGTLVIPKDYFFTPFPGNVQSWVVPGWSYGWNQNAVGIPKNTVFYTPIVVAKDTVFSEIGLRCTGVASSSVELAIYKMENGIPTELIINAGIVDTSTSGNKSIVGDIALNAGGYFIAIRGVGANATCQGIDINEWVSLPVTVSSVNSDGPMSRSTLRALNQTGMSDPAPPTDDVAVSAEYGGVVKLRLK